MIGIKLLMYKDVSSSAVRGLMVLSVHEWMICFCFIFDKSCKFSYEQQKRKKSNFRLFSSKKMMFKIQTFQERISLLLIARLHRILTICLPIMPSTNICAKETIKPLLSFIWDQLRC